MCDVCPWVLFPRDIELLPTIPNPNFAIKELKNLEFRVRIGVYTDELREVFIVWLYLFSDSSCRLLIGIRWRSTSSFGFVVRGSRSIWIIRTKFVFCGVTEIIWNMFRNEFLPAPVVAWCDDGLSYALDESRNETWLLELLYDTLASDEVGTVW